MLPIISHHPFLIDPADDRRIADYARRLRDKRRDLRTDPKVTAATAGGWSVPEGKTLVIDDFTDIALFKRTSLYLQERARLRAMKGDYVVTTTPPDQAFENYVAGELGLGSITWLSVEPPAGSIRLAQTCWQNREIRSRLVHAIRQDGLKYVHPHMASRDVWHLANLLGRTAHRPLTVIAPPPSIARWANDKTEFATVVTDLLGPGYMPPAEKAHNFALLSYLVRKLARRSAHLALKVPNAAGGTGNLRLEVESLRNMSLKQIDAFIRERLAELPWPRNGPLLINVWESDVLDSASIQTWIPADGTGDPMIEGMFSQLIENDRGAFAGCKPLKLPPHLERVVLRATSLLTRLFQKLHYFGRCSFDFLLVGNNLETCRLQFIECNGRWGGTSVPMTLMNRLFDDWIYTPFAAVESRSLARDIKLSWLLSRLRPEIYSVHNRDGWLIPFNPSRIAMRGGLNWIVLGDAPEHVERRCRAELPALLTSRLIG